jgi:hypothetical protein
VEDFHISDAQTACSKRQAKHPVDGCTEIKLTKLGSSLTTLLGEPGLNQPLAKLPDRLVMAFIFANPDSLSLPVLVSDQTLFS